MNSKRTLMDDQIAEIIKKIEKKMSIDDINLTKEDKEALIRCRSGIATHDEEVKKYIEKIKRLDGKSI